MKKYNNQEKIQALTQIKKLAQKQSDIRLIITIKAITNQKDPNGKQYRYFKVYLDRELNHEITKEIGILINQLSITKKYGTCVKLKGCGEDKVWRLSYNAATKAEELGFKKLIEAHHPKYITATEFKKIIKTKENKNE